MKKIKSYPITPVPKPRQTQRDVWLDPPRPCVARYRAFRDQVALHKIELPESGAYVLFVLPMPKSWSEKKKQEMNGKPHQGPPDLDNLIKAISDAIYHNDSIIWDIRATKIWGYEGSIAIQYIEDVAKALGIG